MNRRQQRRQGQGGVALLEEAVHLLRLAPGHLLALYYLGSLPFMAGFLYFWTDMSRSAFAEERHGAAALGVALLFLWMKAWHGVFAGLLHEHLRGSERLRWSFGRWLRVLAVQALVQSSGLLVLPIAFILTIPFAWVFAFYQNVGVFCAEPEAGLSSVCARASLQARLWPGQNHTLLAVLFLFAFFVFFDLALVTLQLPQLLKTLFGIETVFSQSSWSLLNTTFLMTAVGATYLCVDPVVKASYVLRCFYGQSLQSGEDLKVALGSRSKLAVLAAGLAIALGLASLAQRSLAAAEDPIASEPVSRGEPAPTSVAPQELDRAIDEVISRREYSWRLPRIKIESKDERGWFARWMDAALDQVQRWLNAAFRTLRDVLQWLVEKLFRRSFQAPVPSGHGTGWITSLQIFLYVLLAAVVGALGLALWRVWKQRQPAEEPVVAQAIVAPPDLADQNIAADQLPEEGWFKLAQDLLERGELRLGLRALYLAGLAHLGHRELVRIAKFKSNREYQFELRRRAAGQPALSAAFAEVVGIFERVWYGVEEVNQELLVQFRAHLQRITEC